ncbi:hypothetical protein [Nitrosovibrio tenuis]|uniref:Uncharacterized protein n=1 Tax=Nitrosovibrio tenuis TaxID=1233 RepID=A0A1H7GW88_9PROT|nr:hypothetical protein [Nitrosovibrio tenuis]SEK42351.1 hypothetical protein SAMN05216387_101402 [Nitrosovibrio tenuis]
MMKSGLQKSQVRRLDVSQPVQVSEIEPKGRQLKRMYVSWGLANEATRVAVESRSATQARGFVPNLAGELTDRQPRELLSINNRRLWRYRDWPLER